ncbi:MAG: dioxygenase [Chloroflexi bacterium HGW-Chloroflexi-4]|jgi:aromatic ring-opening dioxygenase catalytic subunit (LigB family)|nr:MAG: dioxygenase [Chloroflexi bacterium HGW-Chloroflexi-4]
MNQSTSDNKAQIVYFSHGGGPLPILGDEAHKAMVEFMKKLPNQLHKPDLILVISAHWEENVATLLSAEKPVLFYDYYGFPAQAYEIQYPAAGSPKDAKRIAEILENNNIHAKLDPQRGYDHGVFIPLKLMYPKADIPCLQLSLISGLNPSAHLALGKGLRELKNENILVIGSGFSFHNMRAFSWESKVETDLGNDAFQNWLIETCTSDLSQEEREQRLVDWAKAPAARYCHPREEHLLPLHVCQGMSDKPAEVIFDDRILGKRAIAFKW